MKEEEIAQALSQGIPAADLVRQGYPKSWTYAVARRLREGGSTPLPQPDTNNAPLPAGSDTTLEADPEIIELKKAIRKAELEKQLAEVSGPPEGLERLAALEKQAAELASAVKDVEADVESCPLNGLGYSFECSCGAVAEVSAVVRCTACGRETSYGWFPEK